MLKTLVAGLALASSWTWIIGMYLPRIMMERHGWAGFLAFAVPNVIGCTAFGFVLRKPGAATALRTQIEGEAKWFSSATIAFHVLFAVFLVKSLLGEDGLSVPQSEAPVAAGAFLGAAFLLSLLPKSVFPWLGALVWVGSITLFGLKADTPITSAAPCDLNVLWSLPLFTAGLLICPYLDLTFHEVRRSAHHAAFGIFGVAFALMLLLTVVIWMGDGPRLGPWVLGHLVGQALFTTSWHLGALRREEDSIRGFGWRGLLVPAAVIYGAHTVMTGVRMDDQEWYLRFLFLYGFVFPAAFLLRLRGGMVLLPLAILVALASVPGEFAFVCQCEPYGLVPFLLLLPLLKRKRRA